MTWIHYIEYCESSATLWLVPPRQLTEVGISWLVSPKMCESKGWDPQNNLWVGSPNKLELMENWIFWWLKKTWFPREISSDDYSTSRLRWCKQFSQLQREDSRLKDIFDGILRDDDRAHHYKVQDGVMFMKEAEGNRLVIPKSQGVHLLRRFHNSPFGGHDCVSKTYCRIRGIA